MLSAGATLGPYEVVSPLGAGGMGEVYRARDTKLGREVAIKVLPEAVAADPERLARFEREAKVLASLNHAQIAAIYQVEEAEGKHFLVMELAEGEDLKQRLERGPIAVDDAVGIARQIAEALEAAHEKGIIHRDLKPANVKVTPAGEVKVLDFGLAKALDPGGPEEGGRELSMSPTLTAQMTGAGVILGTAAYMAPEQAKGLEADRRADVWAFGVVVWEMLTGQSLFVGDSVSDTLAAVLRDELDSSALPSETPAVLRALLARCLDRDPKTRLRDIGEARVALGSIAGGDRASTLLSSAAVAPAEAVPEKPASKLPWAIAAIATASALALGFLALRPATAPTHPVQSALVPPEGTEFDVGNGLAVSPDGSAVAFAARNDEGQRSLWVYSFENGESQQLKGTEGAVYPFWSPDSRQLGFMVSGNLKRIAIDGGPAMTLADVREGRGATWGPDDTIVFAPDFRAGLMRIPAAGGEAVELTVPDAERKEQSHRFPVFLPDGRRVLYLSQTAEGGSQVDDSRIEIVDLESGEQQPVLQANSSVAYGPGGHLLFWRDGSLLVAGFDLEQASVEADATPIAEGIGYTGNEFATFSISQTGALVLQSGGLFQPLTGLEILDRRGEMLAMSPDSAYHNHLKLSHDGSRAVYGADNTTLWIFNVERQTRTRFTFEDGDHFDPIWSPDDQWIAYATNRSGQFQVFRKAASGLGSPELLFESSLALRLYDWSRDGRNLSLGVLDNAKDTDGDVAIYDLEEGELRYLVESPFFDSQGTFSPDGRWIAYTSSDSGSFEISLVPLSGTAGRFQVSTAGGMHPHWSPDGKKIYYVNPQVELMEVEVELDGGIEIGIPQELFEIRHPFNEYRPFQVMPDGETFLTVQLEQEIRGGHLTVIQNWEAMLGSR